VAPPNGYGEQKPAAVDALAGELLRASTRQYEGAGACGRTGTDATAITPRNFHIRSMVVSRPPLLPPPPPPPPICILGRG